MAPKRCPLPEGTPESRLFLQVGKQKLAESGEKPLTVRGGMIIIYPLISFFEKELQP